MRDVPFVVSVLQFSSLPKRWRDGSLSGARSPTVLLCVLQLLCGFSDAPFLTGLPCTPSRATQMCGSVPQAPFCTEGSRESGLPSCAPFSIPGVCCPGPDPPSGHEGVGRVAGVPHTDATFSGSLCPRPPPPPPQPVWRRPAQAHLPTRWRRQPWAVPRVPGCSGRRLARAGQGRGRKAGEKRGPRGGAETPPGRTGALAAASRPRLCGGVCSGPGLHHPCPPAGGTRRLPAVSPSARRRGPG